MIKYTIIIIALMLFFSCSTKNYDAQIEKKSELALYNEGMKQFNDKDYEYAIKSMEKLLNNFPLTKYNIEAELVIANSHFNLKEYLSAVECYKEFLKLHPTNEKVPFVTFRIAESYFNQSPKQIDRDQTNLEYANSFYNEVVGRFPDSEFASESKVKLSKIKIRFARRILYVGNFYLKKKKFRASILRFEELLRKYNDLDYDEEVRFKIGYCYWKLKDYEKSKNIFINFQKDFPKSSYRGQIDRILQRMN